MTSIEYSRNDDEQRMSEINKTEIEYISFLNSCNVATSAVH